MNDSHDKRHEMIFQARMNIYYHEGLEAWYARFLNWTALVSVILSSAAFATISDLVPSSLPISNQQLTALFAFSVTVLNGSVLAFGMFQKLSLHALLKKKWIEFHGQAQTMRQENIDSLQSRFHDLNSEEPAPDRKRLNRAYASACASMGLEFAGLSGGAGA